MFASPSESDKFVGIFSNIAAALSGCPASETTGCGFDRSSWFLPCQVATLPIAQCRAFVVTSRERDLGQSPMTGRVLWRRLQRFFKVILCILSLAEEQLIDGKILQGRNKFRIQRQDLLELLVRLFATSGRGKGDPHQVASFHVVRRAIQNLL